jgi:hypothetical protein
MVTKVAWIFLPSADTSAAVNVKRPLLSPDFNGNWLCRQILVKLLKKEFHESPEGFQQWRVTLNIAILPDFIKLQDLVSGEEFAPSIGRCRVS